MAIANGLAVDKLLGENGFLGLSALQLFLP
jgi:hypothetical protein